MELIETPLACQTLYEGKIIRVERMDVRLSDGRVSKREIVRHSGGAGEGGTTGTTGTGFTSMHVPNMSSSAAANGSAIMAKNSPAGME